METEEIDSRIIEIEAKLLEQEHRPFRLIWNFINRKKRYNSNDPRRKAVTKAIIWRLFFSPTTMAFTLSGVLAYATLFFLAKQNDILENQNILIAQQTQLTEATRRSSQMIVLDGVLKDINKELNNNTVISKNLTARIKSLSHTIKPYKFFDYQTDSISKLLSPERSQLLYSLTSSDLDTVYLSKKLFLEANFNYSDLKGLRLLNRHLKNVKLRFSSLENTLLHHSNLTNADLRNTDIKNAGMPYTKLLFTDFRDANFDDVNLDNATLDFADLRGTKFKNVNIGEIKSIDSARVGRLDWFDFLKKSTNVKGVDVLMSNYKIVNVYNSKMKKDIPLIVKK